MTRDIEIGFIDGLRVAEILPDVPMHAASSQAVLENSTLMLVVETESLEHRGGSIYRAVINFHISAPALPAEGDLLDKFSAASAELRAALQGDDLIFSSLNVLALGRHVISANESRAEDRWVFTVQIAAGFSDI